LFSVLLSSLALVGCGSGVDGQPDDFHGGRDPIVFPEGTSLATDGGVDAGNPNEVRGSRVMHYRIDIGDFTQPMDPLAPELKAFTLSDGGTRPLTVQTATDGTFRIPDAPAGRYYLQLGTLYVVSDSRTMNLNRYELGRRDQVGAASVPVTVTASNLEPLPYGGRPRWEAVSTNLGAWVYLNSETGVAAGTTSVDKHVVRYDSMTTGDDRLVTASRGDRLYVNSMSDRDNGTFTYSTLERFFTPGPVTMSPTVSTDLSGTFQVAPQYTASFEWWRSRFEAYQVQVHPQSIPSGQGLSISPTPWDSESWYGYAGDLMNAYIDPGITDLVTSVTYGNPYPFSWGATTTVSHNFQVTATLLPGTTYGGVNGSLSDTRKLSVATAGPIAPRLTPAWDLAVDGRNAQQAALTLGSLTPRITWKAPLVGTPSGYRVRLSRLSVSGTRTVATAVSTFHTSDTSVDVPPGVLQLGQKYAITVYAYLTPGVSYATRPYVLESLVDLASATTVSSILSTPAALAPELQAQPEPPPFEPEPGIKPTRQYLMREQLPAGR
jgi:hypothetical protein